MAYRDAFDSDPPLSSMSVRVWISVSLLITAAAVVLLTMFFWWTDLWLDFRYASDGPAIAVLASLRIALGYGLAILIVNSLAALLAWTGLRLISRFRR